MSKTASHPVIRHELHLRSATVDESARSVESIIATENRALVFDPSRLELIEEILLLDGVQIPRQIPMLENHMRGSLDTHLGSIRNIRKVKNITLNDGRTVDRALVGRLYFADGDERAERAWQLVRQGHLTDISTGNQALEASMIEPGESGTVAGRTFTAGARPLQITTRWRPREGSLVSIGADQDSIIRAAQPATPTRNQNMPQITTPRQTAESLKRDLAHGLLERAGHKCGATRYTNWPIHDIAREALRIDGHSDIPKGPYEIVDLACRGATFSDIMEDFGARVLVDALEDAEEVDLAFWAQRVTVDRYRDAAIHTIDENERMQKRQRGGTAEHADSLGTSPARAVELQDYVKIAKADNQDLVTDQLGAIEAAIGNLGTAAVRTRSDLLYATMLESPKLDDGNDLFSAAHGNAFTLELNKENVQTVASSIRMQELYGRTLALEPRYLITSN